MSFSIRIETFTFMLFTVEMVYTLGTCPIFQPVAIRDKSCFEKESCSHDRDCHIMEKCCENPCGVSQCYTISASVSYRWEKCPLERLSSNPGCEKKDTKFCYKNNCKRCCQHKSPCNPAPSILQSLQACRAEICKDIKCPQGAECKIEELSNKPYCKCKQGCTSKREYICATDYQLPNRDRTYYNKCYLEKDACENNATIFVKYDGKCLAEKPKEVIPLKKPYTRSMFYTINLTDSLSIRCYGDRKGVLLRWYQTRPDGREYSMSEGFQDYLGAFLINGRIKEVLALSINSVGFASYGLYTCKQMFNGTVMQVQIQIQPPEKVIFDRSSCFLQKNQGRCEGKFTNFYFDELANTCYNFTYGGCDGNENNFQTKYECEVKCLSKLARSNIMSRRKPENKRQFIHSGSKCVNEKCEFYGRCVTSNNESKCICPTRCPFRPNRICASDGKTYNTPCAMRLQACKWRKPLVIIYKGKCKGFRDSRGNDISLDTKKLSLCDLRQCNPYAKCYVNPFTRIPHCYCPEQCPFRPDVICASNRKHFLNECFLQRHSCNIGRKLYVLKRGLCFFNHANT